MKLSIITVNLNNRDGLQRTIDSVASQTFKDFEWIVIDGGSIDGSKELIEQCTDLFAYWVSEQDKGIYNAMNKGIRVAKGDYLEFLNSGDWLVDESTLERCFSHDFTADIAYGNMFFVCQDGEMERSNFPPSLTFNYLRTFSLGHNASFIKRELLQNEPYDESFKIVSDWLFYVKMVLENKRFEFVDEIVTCFETNGISSLNVELMNQERERGMKMLVSDALARDYQKMDEMELLLNSKQVKQVLEFGGKKRFYHRMITALLRFIRFIDRSK